MLAKAAEGKASEAQIEIHDPMPAMGYPVHTVYADCPASAWNEVWAILAR
jgi:hypothetical protein